MNILLVGGTGFIGNSIRNHLIAKGHSVTILNRGTVKINNCENIICDRNHRKNLEESIKSRNFDVIIDTNSYNKNQAEKLLNAIKGNIKKIIVISSAAVYSSNCVAPFTETDSKGQRLEWGRYGLGKIRVEESYEMASFPLCIILRPPFILSELEVNSRESWFIQRIINGHPLCIGNNSDLLLQYIHIDDFAKAVVLCAEVDNMQGFNVYNVGSTEIYKVKELCNILGDVMDIKPNIVLTGDVDPEYPYPNTDCAVNTSKFSRDFSWKPEKETYYFFSNQLRYYSSS